jgi:hypothetical protein
LFSSSFHSLLPVAHPLSGSIDIAGRNGLTFVTDAVNGDDAPAFHEKPQHARVQLADVPKFVESLPKRLG